MKLNAIIMWALFLCSFYSWADIPDSVKMDTQKYIKKINNGKISRLNEKELGLIKENIAAIIMHKFQEEISSMAPEAFRKELLEFIDSQTYSLINLTPVKDLIKAFNGNISDGIVRIKYKGIDIPLNITFDMNTKKIRVKFEGLSDNDEAEKCISLLVDVEQSNAYLDYLSTQVACPIPTANRNSAFLVGLAEDVAKTMGAKKIELDDGSLMLCTNNQKSVDFRMLRMLQGKNGLYENFGYSPLMDYVATIKKEMTFAKNIKISHALSTIEATWHQKKVSKEQQNALEIFKSTYPKFQAQKDNNDNLSDYLAWLWEYNCAFYVDLYKLFFMTNLFWPNNPFMEQLEPTYLKWITPL